MIRKWIRTALAATLAFWLTATMLGGCLNEDGGTEIPNELVGKEFIAGKGPAADAEIRFIPVGYVPGDSGIDTTRAPVFSTRSDGTGRFSLKITVPGQYNILAVKDGFKSYRDSVSITGAGQDLGRDTLKTPGNLYGTVALQPNHDPRSATVHVLGTTVFVNVGADGSFLLPDLGAGQYRLKVSTIIAGYAPLFRTVAARAGRTDTLEILRPHYILIPVVSGLQAAPNQDGTVTVRWDKSTYANADGYLIYRDTAGVILPSQSAVARVADTFYIDTVFAKIPKPGQYSELDTATHAITYRVRMLDRGGDPGPAYASATAKAYPPGKAIVSDKWHLGLAAAPFGKRAGATLIEFKGRLWLFGGMDENSIYKSDSWSSPDGLAWKKEQDSVPVANGAGDYPMTVFKERLWTMANRENGFTICSSADGLTWATVAENVTLMNKSGFRLASFADRLWIIDGSLYGNDGVSSTGDGITWTTVNLPGNYTSASFPGVAVYGGALWRYGGINSANGFYVRDIWKTLDGNAWTRVAETSPILPRTGHSMIAAGPNLYCIGGYQVYSDPAGFVENNVSDQVWQSKDGLDWTLSDSHAPFGKRLGTGVALFKGRIWLVGGSFNGGAQALDGVWYMENP